MKIEIVQLENIRSHVKSTVPFAKGFNCLVGGLGCGKSSILYAIDFAFFGEPVGRSFEYLLREGEDNGRIAVQFVQNGTSYRISRGLRRKGKGISQDFDELKLFQDETVVAELKSEAIAEQLRAITGLDKELFREIVWVRQEHLKELLDAAPRERQNRLDELFGLSDYNTAWSNLAIYQRDYETEKKVHEKDPDVIGMERLATEYDKTVEEFSHVQIEIDDTRKKLEAARRSLEDADLQLRNLETLKTRFEELKRVEARMLADLTNIEDASADLAERIESKRSSIDNFKRHLTGLEKQSTEYQEELRRSGISPDRTMEGLRQHLTTYDTQISSLKGEQEAASRGMRENQKRASQLATESLCPLCLQSLTERYKNALLQRMQEQNETWKKESSQLQNDVEELQQLKSRASSAIQNLHETAMKIEDLRNRLKEESQSLDDLSKKFEDRQESETEARTRLEALRLEASKLDVSELEEVKDRRERIFELNSSLKSDLKTKESHKSDLAKRLQETKDRVDRAQEKIERMHKISRAVELVDGIRDAYRSIQPKLRGEFVKVLRSFVQQVLDSLMGDEGLPLNVRIDGTYTPSVQGQEGIERDVSNLSGGERTLVAFAYRLGLGQLIMQSRTGYGLSMLLLDEPTESLGREDGSIDRLAEAISRFKAVEQIIAVTHSEAFAEKAEHVIRLEKEAGMSKVSIER